MDFNSLTEGSPFYILRKREKPILEVGVVKSKTQPKAQYQANAIPNAFVGANVPQLVSVTATIDGREETFHDIPINVEIASRGSDVFTGSRDAMLQAVDSMIQTSKKALEMVEYHQSVKVEGEKMLETLNPRYAEEKRQARTIEELERKQEQTDKKLDSILSILKKLDTPSTAK